MLKRRTPPLFEVLSVPDRNPGPLIGGLGRRPVEAYSRPQRPAPQRTPQPAAQEADGAARRVQVPVAAIFLGIALLMLVGFAVWYFAFELGKQHKKDQLQPYLTDVSVNEPLPSTGLATAIAAPPPPAPVIVPPAPQPEPPAPTSGDPRRPGVNYLHVVTLNWKEAERAAEYLTRSGVPAGLAQAKKAIDVPTAKAKNLPLLVVVLDGIPSEQFRSSEGKRRDLVEKVRRIGKKWQSEERGPSDFGEPFWAKFD